MVFLVDEDGIYLQVKSVFLAGEDGIYWQVKMVFTGR